MDITNFVVNPVTLAILVMALVQFVKDLGVKGNWLKVIALVLGALLAGVFKVREIYSEYVVWIDTGFFALAVGFGACGIYSLINERVPRSIENCEYIIESCKNNSRLSNSRISKGVFMPKKIITISVVMPENATAEQIQAVIDAAQRVGLESPIKDFRVVGNRVELWDLHGRHFETALVEMPLILEMEPSEFDIIKPKRSRKSK